MRRKYLCSENYPIFKVPVCVFQLQSFYLTLGLVYCTIVIHLPFFEALHHWHRICSLDHDKTVRRLLVLTWDRWTYLTRWSSRSQWAGLTDSELIWLDHALWEAVGGAVEQGQRVWREAMVGGGQKGRGTNESMINTPHRNENRSFKGMPRIGKSTASHI